MTAYGLAHSCHLKALRPGHVVLQSKNLQGLLLQPTAKAIHVFSKPHAKKIGLFHVTC